MTVPFRGRFVVLIRERKYAKTSEKVQSREKGE